MMRYEETDIPGVITLHPEPYEDERGTFGELYGQNFTYFRNGVKQISQSRSHVNVIRGLHFQYNPLMSKIMRVIKGVAWIVSVDMRATSDTFLEYHAVECTPVNEIMVLAPAWAARGFCALEEDTVVEYFHDTVYNPSSAVTINYADPTIGIEWPIRNPIVSKQDKNGMYAVDWLETREARILA